MKIGLVTDSIERGSPGLRRYSMRLAEEMLRLSPDDVTLVYRGAGADPFYAGKRTLKMHGKVFMGRQLVFRLQTLRRHFDIIHDTFHFPPFLVPAPYGKVMTVADLTPLLLDTHTLRNRLAHRLFMPYLVRRSDHIVTISEHTRRDVIEHFGVSPENVTATPLAADERLQRVVDPGVLAALRARYGLPETYLVSVGTIEPRKNLGRLLEAMAEVAPHFPEAHLALVGPEGWGDADLAASAKELGIESRVHLLGRVPEEDLAGLYSAAAALVYPSLYEGFGLPPLEAMQCGCPVITSNVSSLPEVVGQAGFLVDPGSTPAIARAIRDVLASPGLRATMQERGLKRARLFSWQRCAEQTLEVYAHVLGQRRREPSVMEPLLRP